MGSSAQNSSGVHWCRRQSGSTRFRSQVRFNRVPEKVLEKVWEALVQSQVRFNMVPEKAPEGSGRLWVQNQVRFNKVPEKVPVKVWEALAQSQVRFNRIPEKVPLKVWEALVQSQVKFNRVPRRFRRRSGRLWRRARSGSTEFRRRFRWRSGRLWCRARSSSTGFREGSGEGLGGFVADSAEVFPALGLQHASERFVKMKVAAVGDTTEAYLRMGVSPRKGLVNEKSWFSSGVRWSGAGRLLCLCWPGPRRWKSFWFTIFPSLMVICWGCHPIWDCNANDTVSFWSSLLDGNKPHTEMIVTDLQIDEVLEEAAASLDKHELGTSGGAASARPVCNSMVGYWLGASESSPIVDELPLERWDFQLRQGVAEWPGNPVCSVSKAGDN